MARRRPGVDNRTPYDTAKLTALLRRVYRRLAKREGDLPRIDELVVTVRCQPFEPRDYSGWSWCDESEPPKVLLTLPDPTKALGETAQTRSVAALFVHELLHLYGYEHEDMDDELRWTDHPGFSWGDPWIGKAFGRYLRVTG